MGFPSPHRSRYGECLPAGPADGLTSPQQCPKSPMPRNRPTLSSTAATSPIHSQTNGPSAIRLRPEPKVDNSQSNDRYSAEFNRVRRRLGGALTRSAQTHAKSRRYGSTGPDLSRRLLPIPVPNCGYVRPHIAVTDRNAAVRPADFGPRQILVDEATRGHASALPP